MSHEPEIPGELEDTDSYDLAQVEPEESLPIQPVNNSRASTVQWKPSSRTVDETLAAGLSNEDLWLLIRRFNKQIYYVKALPDAAGQDIDLNRAGDEQFPPEKLRITIERFYTSVIVGLTEFCCHIGRLRSWKEPIRTSCFCAAYFVACLLDIVIPSIMGVLVVLILFPPIRSVLFSPAPETVDSESSDAKSSAAGTSESHDSITGAPERHKGEAAEQEAANLVNSVATVAMESAAGKYGQGVTEATADEPPDPGTTEVLEIAAEAQTEEPAEDKTKKPMKKKVSRKTDQTMRVLSDITDIYEKFANLLSPTPPFSLITSRLRLAGIFVALALIVPLTSSYWIVKLGAFAIGFGFFGDPVFKKTMNILNSKFPNWKDQLDLTKTLLKGVPTNAQLTLTLLRIGEINSSPLPPPPSSNDNEPSWPIRRKKSKAAITHQSSDQDPSGDISRQQSNETLPAKKPKKRWVFKVLKFVRRTIATAIKGHIAFDRAIAIAGATHTQNLISMLQKRPWSSATLGPLKFDAKFERKRGAVVIDSSKQPPVLYFTTHQSSGLEDLQIESRKKGSVLFQIPVTEIQELKKTEGLGWKGKLIVELTAGSKEAADGLVVVGKEPGQSFHLTGMRTRNQLFNRLVAIDAQFWESR
ncbi:hypothetical protein NUU61_008514 [Penicillium alfredii]|uniref:Uncharacterized protein n=1 Tax=Penicillium alfredii TaxID=1506179 RepID=A0A9W9ELK3_9EURO|nr:uncharacterized protein NUU61_008514 [Penicillium alfredii]KAJ5083935.1 hypothetical protein NUU61_008514 [Penicillium alfredii]